MTVTGTVLVVVFFLCLFINVPIALALGFSSCAALVLFSDVNPVVIAQNLYSSANNFTLLAVPFFVIAGNLMKNGGVSRRLIDFAKVLVGNMTGGLGHVAILTSMIFAAISGSGPATVAALGIIMIPSMVEAGYDKGYAAALQASSGGIGVIIPPSIPMVVYAALAGVSISAMFAAGIIPGILVGISLMIVNYFISKKKGYRGEAIQKSPAVLWKATKEAFLALLMPVIILGGIYTGIFTPTESAGIAVIYGFIVGAFVYKELRFKELKEILLDSAITSAVCLIIMAMAQPFAWVITTENIPTMLAQFFMAAFDTPFKFLLAVNILFLILGCFVSSMATLIILTPILIPIVTSMGIDPVHFGIIMVINLEIGMMTPPFGVDLFVACGIAKIPLERIAGKVLPFVGATVAALFLTTYIPWISMFLPKAMGLIK